MERFKKVFSLRFGFFFAVLLACVLLYVFLGMSGVGLVILAVVVVLLLRLAGYPSGDNKD